MSRDSVVEALVEAVEDTPGELRVCSPMVGWYRDAPKVGEVLVGGSRVGRLITLGRTRELVLPSTCSGRVRERLLRHRRIPVEYGQLLLRLVPIEAKEWEEGDTSHAGTRILDLPEGCRAVTSPTHGMFYRRPRPDAPAYVEEGQLVEEGTTLGLVEVMKCFSAIVYGGEGMPPRAEIVEIRANDASEIQADQILFVVKPA